MKCQNPICNNDPKNTKFCSRSCAAVYNNKLFHKRQPEGKCKTCDKPVITTRVFCSANCRRIHQSNVYTDTYINKTLAELSREINDQNKYVKVRTNARMIYQHSGRSQSCFFCQYNRHVEICHIKPISEFSPDTTISIVNHIDNLVALCPNCHWEFDHGLITIKQ